MKSLSTKYDNSSTRYAPSHCPPGANRYPTNIPSEAVGRGLLGNQLGRQPFEDNRCATWNKLPSQLLPALNAPGGSAHLCVGHAVVQVHIAWSGVRPHMPWQTRCDQQRAGANQHILDFALDYAGGLRHALLRRLVGDPRFRAAPMSSSALSE